MQQRNNVLILGYGHTEAQMAVGVAECGLDSWRAAKAAWLDSFAAFAAAEAAAAPLALQ
jgi:hypothetical protein